MSCFTYTTLNKYSVSVDNSPLILKSTHNESFNYHQKHSSSVILVLRTFIKTIMVAAKDITITEHSANIPIFCCRFLVIMWFLFGEVSSSSGCVILLWHSLSLPYNYYSRFGSCVSFSIA